MRTFSPSTTTRCANAPAPITLRRRWWDAMVRLVDECLRGAALRPPGRAPPPPRSRSRTRRSGTGTFLLGVLRRIASTIEADEGAGAVPGAIKAAASRLYGFELQFGPFAVAQLRIIAEMGALMRTERNPHPAIPDLHLYVTDALGNPYVEEGHADPEAGRSRNRDARPTRSSASSRSRRSSATRPTRSMRPGAVAGSRAGSAGRPSALDLWVPPRSWGVGASAKHLKNLYGLLLALGDLEGVRLGCPRHDR